MRGNVHVRFGEGDTPYPQGSTVPTPRFNLTWDYLPLGDGLTVMLPFDKEGGEVSPPEG
jgi:hypothetical protein